MLQVPGKAKTNRLIEDGIAVEAHPLPDDPVSLWQLMVSQARCKWSIQQKRGAPFVDMTSLITRKKAKMASLSEDAILEVPKCFKQRLFCFRKLCSGPREKLLRWEIIKMQMIHAVHEEGVLFDDSQEGRIVRIPLVMSYAMLAGKDLEELQNTLKHSAVQIEMHKLWNMWESLGGIRKNTYFALCKIVVQCFFVHLNEREIHQLILADSEAELPNGGEGNVVMSQRDFFRFLCSLCMLWMENCSTAEAYSFLQSLGELWANNMKDLDLKFAAKFSRKDPSPLIPALVGYRYPSIEKIVLH